MKATQTNLNWAKRLVPMFGLAMLAAIFWQAHSISELRDDQGRLQSALSDTQQAIPAPHELKDLRAAAEEAEQLRTANRELHLMRNEAAQLRQQRREIDFARAEHQRLQALKKTHEERQKLSRVPGFVPRESWRDAGLATPQDTVQTFFWAMREKRFDRLQQCLAPGLEQQQMVQGMQNPSAQADITKLMQATSGFVIVDVTFASPGEAHARVLSPLFEMFGDEPRTLPLHLHGQEWRLERAFGP